MGLWKRSINGWFWQGIRCLLIASLTLSLTVLVLSAQEPVTAPPAASQSPAPPPPPPSGQTARPMDQGADKIHIVVGHSLLIHTPSRVKRILTGNPQVIESVVTSPAELVVTAKTPGSSSLMLWDEAGKSRNLDVYSDLDVASLRNSLDQSFPYTNLDVEAEGDKLVLVGTVPNKDVADQVLKMAGNFSKDVVDGLRLAPPAHERQVMLKVRFAEADRNKLSQFGINIFSTGATNTIGTIGTQQFGPIAEAQNSSGTGGSALRQFIFSDLLNIFLFRPDLNLGATIKALQEKNVLQILAEPNLMAISGQPARFLAGGEFPYPVVQGGAAGQVPTVTIEFRPYGVKLEFTGIIEDNDVIRLKVAPEVSALDYANAITLSGFILPAISTRRAETEIELKDGQSFGIAGLLDQRTIVQMSKIPGIGDIPIIGELFKSRNSTFQNSELIVLVTPTIVDPVMGKLPAPGPEVNFPMKKLDTGEFDKNLPYKPQSSEVKQ